MTQAQLPIGNPNYLQGCHPLNLRNHLEDIFHHDGFDPTFPIVTEKSEARDVIGNDRRGALDHFLQKISEQDLPGKQHAASYLTHKYRCNCKYNTIRSSYTAVTFFLTFLKDTGKFQIEQVKRSDLEAFIEHEQDRGLKPGAVKTRLGTLHSFARFLIDSGTVHPDVVSRKLRIKLPILLPRAIDPDDLTQLLSVIDGIRDRAMILVLLRTGMRIGELLMTKVGDINFTERKILIHEWTKNSIGRVVYFSDDARDALITWLKDRDPGKEFLFYGQGNESLCYSAARVRFVKCLNQAGLIHKGYTLHSLRHTYATELLNAGMRLEVLQQLLGHTNIEVTRRYARLTDKTREADYFRAMSIIEKGEDDPWE